jgi:hypothetical protein
MTRFLYPGAMAEVEAAGARQHEGRMQLGEGAIKLRAWNEPTPVDPEAERARLARLESEAVAGKAHKANIDRILRGTPAPSTVLSAPPKAPKRLLGGLEPKIDEEPAMRLPKPAATVDTEPMTMLGPSPEEMERRRRQHLLMTAEREDLRGKLFKKYAADVPEGSKDWRGRTRGSRARSRALHLAARRAAYGASKVKVYG